MPQLIGIIIILVIAKLIFDYVKDHFIPKPSTHTTKKKSGEVIDLSNAWINTNSLPYQVREQALNKQELKIYEMISEILQHSSYTINIKMGMSDLLTLPMQTANYREYLNRLKDRTIDMVILEHPGLKPALVINMESQHENKKKQIADQFRDNALKSAELPSLHIDPNAKWSNSLLCEKLRESGLLI